MAKKPKVDKGSGTGVSKEDCLALGEQALSSFTGDELKDYVSMVFERSRSYPDLKGQAAIKRAMAEINDETRASLFHDCSIKANNTYKFEQKADLIRDGKSTMRTLLTYRAKKAGQTVAGSQASARSILADSFFDENWSKEHEDYVMDPDNERSIYDALDGRNAPPMAKEIAKMVEKFRDTRNSESVRSNAIPIENLSKYKFLDHMHDATAMMNGGQNLVQRAKNLLMGRKSEMNPKAAWVAYIKDRLDLKAMFTGSKAIGLDGELNMDYVDQVLSNSYENITTNKNEMFTRSLVANDREAVKKKQRMYFLFKDWRSWGEYNSLYGQGSMMKALMADIQSSGGKIGMADFMGDSPASMFMDLNKVQIETGVKLPPGATMESWNLKNEYTFKWLMGANPKTVNPSLSNFMAGLRAYTSAIKAPYITISSMSDQAHIAEYVGRFGANRFKSMAYLLANTFNNKLGSMAFEDRKVIARQFKLMCDSQIGYMANAIDAQNVGGFMNRASSKIFKFVGAEAADKGNKISVLHLMADTLGRQSNKSWESLPDAAREQLDNHGFTKEEWNLLRTKTKKNLFTLDNVNDLTEEELRQHASVTADVPLAQLKNDLYRKVYSLFDVASQNSILSPDAFSKANMLGGIVPGTVQGELWKMVTHFKSYPMDFMDRVWMQGFQNADGKMAKLMFATRLMAMTLPLSFLSTWFAHWSQGKSLPDLDDPKFWMSMALPGMGIFLSLMDSKNQNQDLLFNVARSPSMGLISNMLASSLALITGDPDNAAKRFKKASRYILPMDTTPFLSPFLREALGEESYLQPGQTQVYGA